MSMRPCDSPLQYDRLMPASRLCSVFIISLALCAEPRERHFSFEYRATVPSSLPGKIFRLWIPIPHDDEYQQITNLRIESSEPYRLAADELGNRIASIESSKPPSVTVKFDCTRKEHLRPAPASTGAPPLSDAERARWLAPDRMVPLDDTIRKWAGEVVAAAHAHTDLEMARAIYDHVVATVKYDKTGKGWGRGDIYYACDARRGNCTDFHAIFIGYARAMGIPARFSIGFPPPPERDQGSIAGYHCWAEFYANGIGWIPIDASEAAKNPSMREYFFGTHDENRVEFTRGRDLQLTPRQAAGPLNYFVYPYAEADGKPIDDLDHIFSWKDQVAQAVPPVF
jgi:transglutaminase-like putative cysteine protease